jgi:hypothetical protein
MLIWLVSHSVIHSFSQIHGGAKETPFSNNPSEALIVQMGLVRV